MGPGPLVSGHRKGRMMGEVARALGQAGARPPRARGKARPAVKVALLLTWIFFRTDSQVGLPVDGYAVFIRLV